MIQHELLKATPPRFWLDAILSKVVDEFLQAVCEFFHCSQRERKSGSQDQDFGRATKSLISKNGFHHLDTATKQ